MTKKKKKARRHLLPGWIHHIDFFVLWQGINNLVPPYVEVQKNEELYLYLPLEFLTLTFVGFF
jgi:hypothetical protein